VFTRKRGTCPVSNTVKPIKEVLDTFQEIEPIRCRLGKGGILLMDHGDEVATTPKEMLSNFEGSQAARVIRKGGSTVH